MFPVGEDLEPVGFPPLVEHGPRPEVGQDQAQEEQRPQAVGSPRCAGAVQIPVRGQDRRRARIGALLRRRSVIQGVQQREGPPGRDLVERPVAVRSSAPQKESGDSR